MTETAIPLPAGVGEVEIRGDHLGDLNEYTLDVRARSNRLNASIVSEARVLAEIAAHRARGVRVLLVMLEVNGGNGGAGLNVYRALRAFAWAGGTVIVHVVGWVASLGPLISLAGQYVFMDPGARLALHSAGGPEGAKNRMNKLMLGLALVRTFTPRPVLEDWLSRTENDEGKPSHVELTAPVALRYGWADQVGTHADVVAFATALARGVRGLVSADAAELAAIEVERSGDLRQASAYFPQASNGYAGSDPKTTAIVPSLIDGIAVGVKNGIVPDAGGTRGGAVDNIWPNPTSESDPPPGADLTRAEWAGRVNLGIGTAPAGAWVRSPGTGANLSIDFTIPAIPGEPYYMEAQVAAAAAGANKGGFVKITALDSAGASLGSASSAENDATGFATETVAFTMPAATTQARFSLVNGSDAAAHAYFDTILVRRSIDLKLFAVEPWAASRLVAWCRVSINAAGTGVSYHTTAEAIGFDPFTAPALVQVGSESQKRLRLTLAALPNSQSLANMKFTYCASRNANGIGAVGGLLGSPQTQLFLHGWNLSSSQFDFFASWEDTTSGNLYPYPWGSIDGTNGSVWDIQLFIAAPVPFKFF